MHNLDNPSFVAFFLLFSSTILAQEYTNAQREKEQEARSNVIVFIVVAGIVFPFYSLIHPLAFIFCFLQLYEYHRNIIISIDVSIHDNILRIHGALPIMEPASCS